MKIRYLASGLTGLLFLISPFTVMSEEMTLDEAKAEIERLEQENISLKEQLDNNEMSIAEYKEQMASIEQQIADLQAQQ